jgi:hypothetical protein
MVKFEYLDSTTKKENLTIVIGRNILLKIVEDEKNKNYYETRL